MGKYIIGVDTGGTYTDVCVIDDKGRVVIGKSPTTPKRLQDGVMDALENAGRLAAFDYRRSILFSTLSPCDMCSGAVLLYGIPKVVIGENQTFKGPESYLRSRGVDVVILNDEECIRMMTEFIRTHPQLWNEDIGELD